jgi:trehalose synthase-fused probable maltokinase
VEQGFSPALRLRVLRLQPLRYLTDTLAIRQLAMPSNSSPEETFLALLKSSLPQALPRFLTGQRWFGGKARTIRSAEILDIVPFFSGTLRSYFILAQVEYTSGPADTYDIPLVLAHDGTSLKDSSCVRVSAGSSDEIVLGDALTNEQFLNQLLEAIAEGLSVPGGRGRVRAVGTAALRSLWQPSRGPLVPSVMNREQSNSSVVYENRLVLKMFRRLEQGLNPDLEIGAFLIAKTSFRNVPPLAGYLEYLNGAGTSAALAMLQGYVANQGDAWQYTLKALAEYYENAPRWNLGANDLPDATLLELCGEAIPDQARQRIGPYLDAAALLGRRTGELHLALASVPGDPEFAPQPFTAPDRQALANSAIQLLTANFALLRRLRNELPDQARDDAGQVLQLEEIARRRFQRLTGLSSSAMVTRIHGDYHLGQVLFTGSDFVIIDFEGEPARPLEERRKKRSPLQDVAGMLRSFHYAAYAPLLQQKSGERPPREELRAWANRAQYWQRWVSAAFLKAYLEVSKNSIVIPQDREELALLLDLYLLDKAIYELGYELNNRPGWVRIPMDGIAQLLQPAISN